MCEPQVLAKVLPASRHGRELQYTGGIAVQQLKELWLTAVVGKLHLREHSCLLLEVDVPDYRLLSSLVRPYQQHRAVGKAAGV